MFYIFFKALSVFSVFPIQLPVITRYKHRKKKCIRRAFIENIRLTTRLFHQIITVRLIPYVVTDDMLFIAQLFNLSGYEVVFIDVVDALVEKMNNDKEYPIYITKGDSYDKYTVTNVRAVNGKDENAVAAEIATADVMATAVGINILKLNIYFLKVLIVIIKFEDR